MSCLKNSKVLTVLKYTLLLLLFSLMCGLSFALLYCNKIKGPEFVALIIASMVSCLVVNFLNDIQEVSIGGNLLKLKDISNRSEVLLKNMQIEYFKIRIDMVFVPTGFWDEGGSSVYSSRTSFYEVIRDIKSEGLLSNNILRQKIENQLNKTLQCQLEDVQKIGRVLDSNPLEGEFEPMKIRSLITEDIISKSIKTNDEMYKDKLATKNMILQRIEIYENLYKASKWLEE